MGKPIFVMYGDKQIILGMYSKNKCVVYASPNGTEHIAHATWLNPRASNNENRGNIDYFLVAGGNLEGVGHLINTPPLMIPNAELNAEEAKVEEKHGVYYKIPQRFQHLEPMIRRVAIRDIWDFTWNKLPPHVHERSLVEYVPEIVSEAAVKQSSHANLDIMGKQDFYPECILDVNLDFAKWCQSSITSDGKLKPSGSCIYCYASYKHSGYPNVFKVDSKRLAGQIREAREAREKQGLQTRYLRLGKRTEAGADIFREQLTATLEVCIETEMSVVMPTKFLKFDKTLAQLFKKTDSSVLFSIGNNELEEGACMHGRTNEYRFEQCEKYLEAGVRAMPYVLVDAVRENGGGWFSENLQKALAFPQVQIIPIRLRYIDTTTKILGSWHGVVGEQEEDMLGHEIGGYEVMKDSTRLHKALHPSLAKLVQDNNQKVRMCSHNHSSTWCGKCFVSGEKGCIVPTENIVVTRKNKRPHKKEKIQGEEFKFKD